MIPQEARSLVRILILWAVETSGLSEGLGWPFSGSPPDFLQTLDTPPILSQGYGLVKC